MEKSSAQIFKLTAAIGSHAYQQQSAILSSCQAIAFSPIFSVLCFKHMVWMIRACVRVYVFLCYLKHCSLYYNSLSLVLGRMMTGNETTRRRHVQGRASGTFETTSPTGRPNTVSSLHQQQHLHHHHHDHHHYHYHHHYHHFPRQLNGDQDQTWLSSGGNTAPAESLSQSGPRNNDQEGPSVNSRLALMSNFHGVRNPREAAMEARDRLDERLRAVGLLSHRHGNAGLTGNFLEEFSLLFEDDEDTWSDDELWELGIQEWLAALGFGEGWHSDVLSSSEPGSLSPGLSKAVIRRLHKEVFVPKGPRRDTDIGNAGIGSSEQDDCSVCLEHFLSGQQLIRLPCKHRFHPDCLTPWLESHAHCPYCRGKVTFEGTGEASSSQSGNGSSVSMIEDDLIAWMEAVDSRVSRLNMG